MSAVTDPPPSETAESRDAAIQADVAGDREPPWIERSAASLLALLGTSISIFLRLMSRPWQAPRVASDGNTAAPPLSFLIVSVLVAGLQSRISVYYYGRTVDSGALSLLMEAGMSWGLQEILLLTVPVVAIVVMTGITAARWTLRTETYFGNPVLRSVCYAAGTQLVGIAICLATIMTVQAVPVLSREVGPILFRDDVSFFFFGLLILLPAFQIERVISSAGRSRIARNHVARGGLSFITATTLLCGVVTTGMVTFDFRSSLKRGLVERAKADHAQTAECGVLASVMSQETTPTLDGQLRVEQVVVLNNVSENRWAVPRPRALEVWPRDRYRGEVPDELAIESCSVDWAGEYGWVLEPGETRILQWTLLVPDPLNESVAFLVTRFACEELDWEKIAMPTDSSTSRKHVQVLVDWGNHFAPDKQPKQVAGSPKQSIR